MRKFYIFDLDGTLCDSMEFWRAETSHLDFGDLDAMERAYDNMREHYRNDISLKTGVPDFLREASLSGVKMCIASATRRNVSEPFLDKTGLLDFMEFYIDCHEIRRFKERPDIYLQAAKRLGAEISECVVFEDAEYCAKTAKSAGFYVAGVFDKTAAREGNTARYCDLFVEDWRDVKEII